MTIDQWGFYALLGVYVAAFFGSIIKETYLNNELKESKGKILFCIILIILTALVISAASIFFGNVTYGANGNVGSFGQAGDFFGGILNPIFGFLTVILLLLTLSLERKSKDNTDLKNQIMLYESIINNRLKELEGILKTEPLNDLFNEFHDYHKHKPDTFYIADVNPKNLKDSRRITIGSQAEKIFFEERDSPGARRSSVTNAYTLNNYNVIWRARKAIKDIRDVSIELIKISNDKFYKKYQYNKYMEFVMENSSFGLIAVEELSTYSHQLEKV